MKLFVTGGAGYIGSVVGALLVEAGHEVTVLDDCSTGHADAVPTGATLRAGRASTVAGEVLDPVVRRRPALRREVARRRVGRASRDLYWRNNVGGTLALLDAMRRHGVRRIVFSSTAATYGAPGDDADHRGHAAGADQPLRRLEAGRRPRCSPARRGAYDLAAVSLRYFNVAGAYGAPRRAARSGDAPDPQPARGRRRRRRERRAVRHRLPDPRRHRRPRLPPRRRPRRRPPAGALGRDTPGGT